MGATLRQKTDIRRQKPWRLITGQGEGFYLLGPGGKDPGRPPPVFRGAAARGKNMNSLWRQRVKNCRARKEK